MDWLKKNVPILGALGGDGLKTSGAAFATGAGAMIAQTDAPGWVKCVCYAGIAAAWAIAGALKRG